MGAESGRACGLLLNNSWRTTFDIGGTHERELRFGAARGPLDHDVLHGPDPKNVRRRCGSLTGLPPLPRPDVLPVFVRAGAIIPWHALPG